MELKVFEFLEPGKDNKRIDYLIDRLISLAKAGCLTIVDKFKDTPADVLAYSQKYIGEIEEAVITSKSTQIVAEKVTFLSSSKEKTDDIEKSDDDLDM